jgi:aminoglycoside phosphotransferase (APT) family kinase protein
MTEAETLVRDLFGEVPTGMRRMTFGHNSVTYEVTLPAHTVILRTNTDANVFRKTEHNLSVLRELGLPVPEVIARDLSLTGYPFAYLLLEKIPGRDLRFELADMTHTQQETLARQIVGYQERVASLPEGQGFGYAPIGEKAPFASWTELVIAETRRNLPENPTPEQTDLQERVFALLEPFAPYLEGIKPTCFLDDLTIKNVLVERGELQGLIDFDVVCYGDPLWTLGLTGAAIVSDISLDKLSYLDALCRAYPLDEGGRQVVRLYAALFALTFFAHAEPEQEARLLGALKIWMGQLEACQP